MLVKYFALVVAALLPLAGQACSSSSGQSHMAAGGSRSASGGAAVQAGGQAGDVRASGGAAADGSSEAGAAGSKALNGTAAEAAGSGEDALIVPHDLDVMQLEGENGILDMVALTLHQGAANIEVFAALKNNGTVPACDAAVSVQLYDKAQQSLAAGVSAALTNSLYQRTDGSAAIAACVAPGAITMAAISDFPANIAVEDVGYVVYQCPFFALDVVPITGFTVALQSTATAEGMSYTGSFVNGLDVTVTNPSVTVFPVNRVGRPLGMATASSTTDVPAGSSWAFDATWNEAADTLDSPVADSFAYSSAGHTN